MIAKRERSTEHTRRVKGSAILAGVRLLKEAGIDASEIPAPIRQYFEDTVLVSAWYPESDWLALMNHYADTLRREASHGEVWELVGCRAAELDAGERGLYRHWVRRGDAAATLRSLGVLWSLHRDTGRRVVEVHSEYHATARLEGYDPASPSVCRMTSGYVRKLLELAATPEPMVFHSECVLDGYGECVWECLWRHPQTPDLASFPWRSTPPHACAVCGCLNPRSMTTCRACQQRMAA